MDQIKKNRAIRWFNYLMLIVNITALLTIMLANRSTENNEHDNQVTSVEFLRKRLNLTEDQYNDLIKLNDKTFRIYYINLDLLCEANIDLLEEMSKDEPNQEEINRITKYIGNINASLKKQTVKHFEHVRSICTPAQKQELVKLFKEIMQLENQCTICNRKTCPRKERLNNLGEK